MLSVSCSFYFYEAVSPFPGILFDMKNHPSFKYFFKNRLFVYQCKSGESSSELEGVRERPGRVGV